MGTGVGVGIGALSPLCHEGLEALALPPALTLPVAVALPDDAEVTLALLPTLAVKP